MKDQNCPAPFDSRFPAINQTRYCYVSFLDYHRCAKKRGADYEACQYYKSCYETLCPNDWIEKWTNQIEKGIFAGYI
ncbi:PREDICTED: cytochrome c oxidase subunit 6B [Ceratosolen solmsi marchali]|uniref:Cytochrome c oxidase subunit 6B n=2 Tax=Ceratosolen solmsi TaxID=142686 RepID=A0AAJ6YQ96_9HYME|nr:PREDICTED: cytochrome c oxidase subunit 6B [Ceratosolen solmsi marchali]AIX97472.1 mitochondrial cytochrome c oxidase subunit VIb polypeptide 1 [Ceratosolen solmsi]AIX97502.1 mitochondrial Cox6b1 [Ceratosolen solmsi]